MLESSRKYADGLLKTRQTLLVHKMRKITRCRNASFTRALLQTIQSNDALNIVTTQARI